MVNSKSELTNLESFKFNSKRSSLRNFKNWSPFTDNSENNDTKKSEKDDYLTNKTGIVRRMANSISSQLLNKSNIERPKSNILPRSRNSFSASTKTDNKDEILYSTIKPKIKISKPNEANESNLYLKETVQGINVQLKEPHLICVSTDAKNQLNKTSIKIYPLKIGKTTIGSCSKNDFVIKGPGIEPEHCFIENNLKFKSSENLAIKYPSSNNYRRSLTSIFRRNKTKDSINSNNLITLNPISKLCALDGVLIESPCVLTSGSLICLGESEYFRFNNPISENNLNDRKEQKFIADDRNFKSEKIHSIQNSASGQEKLTQLNSKNIDKLKEIKKEKMLSNQEQESQIIGLETLKSDCDPMDKDLDSKDNDDKKLSKVRFNLPEKKTLAKNNESNLAEDKKKNLNKFGTEIDSIELELINYLNKSKLNEGLVRKSIWIPGYGLVNFF
ncbi:unnamed protein product [Brachionus calyciflorus]|uniref:FHA domain-containing protein n=1 Tax=Brachionus calyciflorus TaxID=104777 RepID=A0A813MDB5_9BILA|nr:unnamed protein product [Brachionus calyciflorus]